MCGGSGLEFAGGSKVRRTLAARCGHQSDCIPWAANHRSFDCVWRNGAPDFAQDDTLEVRGSDPQKFSTCDPGQ